MSKPGTIGWIDNTVEDAKGLRDFYQDVTGWQVSDVSTGDYNDYCLTPQGKSDPVAGICHRQTSNANVPPGWIIYITVEDIEKSAELCRERGGEVIDGPRNYGSEGRFCIIRDPAGCVAALYSENKNRNK